MNAPATESMKLHLSRLKEIPTADGRREYLQIVERAETKFVVKWLKDEFAAWWEKGRKQ